MPHYCVLAKLRAPACLLEQALVDRVHTRNLPKLKGNYRLLH